MIAVIATIHVREDKVADFERAVRELEAAVKAREPDCLLYRMARSRTEPLTYKNLEIFRDQAALDSHQAQEHFKIGARALRDCVSGPSTVEFLDTLG